MQRNIFQNLNEISSKLKFDCFRINIDIRVFSFQKKQASSLTLLLAVMMSSIYYYYSSSSYFFPSLAHCLKNTKLENRFLSILETSIVSFRFTCTSEIEI